MRIDRELFFTIFFSYPIMSFKVIQLNKEIHKFYLYNSRSVVYKLYFIVEWQEGYFISQKKFYQEKQFLSIESGYIS